MIQHLFDCVFFNGVKKLTMSGCPGAVLLSAIQWAARCLQRGVRYSQPAAGRLYRVYHSGRHVSRLAVGTLRCTHVQRSTDSHVHTCVTRCQEERRSVEVVTSRLTGGLSIRHQDRNLTDRKSADGKWLSRETQDQDYKLKLVAQPRNQRDQLTLTNFFGDPI